MEDVLVQLCGSRSSDPVPIWVHGHVGLCFNHLLISCIPHVLLAVSSACHAGAPRHGISGCTSAPWLCRTCISFVISCLCAADLVLGALFPREVTTNLEVLNGSVSCLAWITHFLSLLNLRKSCYGNTRGPVSLMFAVLLVTPSVVIMMVWLCEEGAVRSPLNMVLVSRFSVSCLRLFCIIVYLCAFLVPPRHLTSPTVVSVNDDGEYSPLVASFPDSDEEPAEDGESWLSRFFYFWMKPLLQRGACGALKCPQDVYLLPRHLQTPRIRRNFFSKCGPGAPSLLWALHSCFGAHYYSLGVLKLFSCALIFMGPVLLNLLVNFMETRQEALSWGVLYTIGLFTTGLLGALVQNQFTHQINKLMLSVRASVLTSIYQKTLRGEGTGLAKFSPGEVINFMSTDADRISNFCRSFHELWSLPVQFSVTLYLMYLQVGIAFLGGLGLALLLVPLNKVIASRIMHNNKEMLQHKDARVKLVTELLSGMRVVKFYTWEEHFARLVSTLRARELRSLRAIKLLDAVCVYLWAALPVLISIITFITYVLLGHQLTAAKVFTSLALVGMLILPLNNFPWVLNGVLEAKVSLERVESFLGLPEQDMLRYYRVEAPSRNGRLAVEMRNATFSWGSEVKESRSFTLFIQQLSVKEGMLLAVVGKVGCGKSSLLSAITGELGRLGGDLFVAHQEFGFGFVAQESWIQFATIRENILFGKEYNERLYKEVLEACALSPDLNILPAGDQTEVGENGVTLSGGQKARISLARAVYQEKDIYLLDDPLAAVDTDVAAHLMDRCILGILRHKTRILCTHRTELLEKADVIVLMEDGEIVCTGPPEEVLPRVQKSPKLTPSSLQTSDDESSVSPDSLEDGDEGPLAAPGSGFKKEEEKKEGAVSLQVYVVYWRAVGATLGASVLLALLFMQASRNVSDWWLSFWITRLPDAPQNSSLVMVTPPVLAPSLLLFSVGGLVAPMSWEQSMGPNTSVGISFYLSVYGGIAVANSVFTALRALLFALGTVRAATVIHERLLKRVLRATVTFFDSTPAGRIINRFSSDLYCVDDSLPFILNIFLANAFGLLGMLVMISYGLPLILPILVPLAILYYYIQRYYRHSSRELKRLQSVTLSPIYSHFSETLTGLTTIRATRHADRFAEECESRMELNQRCLFACNTAVQWLDIRLQMIGVVVVTAIAIIALIQHQRSSGDPGLVGLSLSYALSITGLLSGLISSFTQTEAMMVSVERAEEYATTLPSEPTQGTVTVQPEWPQRGSIEFRDAVLCYRRGLPNALDGVSFIIRAGEKIGVVGRTGSGKSTMFLALFRMMELNSGLILIDDVSTRELSLDILRSRLAIIPQDAFLLSGSVRQNLDPLSHHTDEELQDVLGQCHLQDLVSRIGGLSADVGERGKNFSLGQRQLLCLARALLTEAKVLCIDEATASVDHQTDHLLQATIRQRFQERTVLTIAHRLHTIMDSDRVLVMHAGKVAEFDSPRILSSNRDSHFYRLIHSANSE
ncbi:ATP-binding cassette sub-family C member 10-like [Bufo bufo]|uniref:ATP-binding cassette sub-family C member 10-like n=1 Tax=Bufo bufo TaxID=8384 RepID=UPI001ABDA553|nr:ATP-binding cassette sub-family C member 10-like [Bufo bufo]XP_040286794.1 ATP-binding cassette sub-family C member 10-like [Bufo bufo]XP_040286795.1 ATP-binding cassette sub-family C member 10-like [Bufo bufo]